MGEFGEKFRKAREQRQISVEDVANVTKISARMLRAIEEEKFDVLPGGVFNRGFIRTYAKHVGLEPEDAINDYLACLQQAQIDASNVWDAAQPRDAQPPVSATAGVPGPAKPAVTAQKPIEVEELPALQLPRIEDRRAPKKQYLSRPSFGIPWIKLAVALCLVSLTFFLWTRHSGNTRTAGAASSSSALLPPTTAAAATAPQSAPPPQPSTPPPAATVTPAPHPSLESPQPAAATTPVTTPPAKTHAPAATPVETSADPNAVKVEKRGDVTIRSFGAPAAKPPENTPPTLALIIRANENSWISVTRDGQLVTQETLIAPAATSFHASRELVVRVGNAAGISFLWNGGAVPAQGAEGEAKTFVFDAQGMRISTPPQPASQP